MNKFFTPWEFEVKDNFIVLYGNDLALALSLSREEGSIFYDEEDLTYETLYGFDFFGNNRIRSIVTPKTANIIINMYQNQAFYRACTLIVDGNFTPKGEKVTFVRCDHMTSAQSKLFVNFHCKRLSLSLPKNPSTIKNLDEIRFGSNVEELNLNSDNFTVWGSLRLAQLRNSFPLRSIYQHLELWSRDSIPSVECLEMIYNKVRFELETYKVEQNRLMKARND